MLRNTKWNYSSFDYNARYKVRGIKYGHLGYKISKSWGYNVYHGDCS